MMRSRFNSLEASASADFSAPKVPSPMTLDKFMMVDAPHFCAGADIVDGKVSSHPYGCAPIIRYMVGWTGKQVSAYCRKKRWKVSVHRYGDFSAPE